MGELLGEEVTGKQAASTAGSVAGSAIGNAILPGIGGTIGSFIGGKIGGLFGRGQGRTTLAFDTNVSADGRYFIQSTPGDFPGQSRQYGQGVVDTLNTIADEYGFKYKTYVESGYKDVTGVFEVNVGYDDGIFYRGQRIGSSSQPESIIEFLFQKQGIEELVAPEAAAVQTPAGGATAENGEEPEEEQPIAQETPVTLQVTNDPASRIKQANVTPLLILSAIGFILFR